MKGTEMKDVVRNLRRRGFALLLAGLMVFGAAGCGNAAGEAAQENAPEAAEAEANEEAAAEEADAAETETGEESGKEGYLIGYSLNSMDSTMKTMADYFEGVAKEKGWEPVLQNANGDVTTELNNMEALMNMGCDAVVIMGCDTEGSAAAIEELGAAGIPVIIAGRAIAAKEESYYTYVAETTARQERCRENI